MLLLDCIKMKLSDPDEKVRSTACKTIEEIILYSDLKQIDKSMLESVEERTKDKKVVLWTKKRTANELKKKKKRTV